MTKPAPREKHESGSFTADDGPLVTVVTAVLNGRVWLPRCIESVRRQSYPHTRHLVVDGGSSDGTLSILEGCSDALWKWVSEPDHGHFDAMNKGTALADDGYLLFLNSDDYLLSEHSISSAVAHVSAGTSPPELIAGRIVFSYRGRVVPGWEWPIDLGAAFRYGFAHQATLVHRDLCRAHPYDLRFPLTADTRFWKTLFRDGSVDVAWIDETITVFELGGLSTDPRHDVERLLEASFAAYLDGSPVRARSLVKGLARARIKVLLRRCLGEQAYYLGVLHFVNWLRGLRAGPAKPVTAA